MSFLTWLWRVILLVVAACFVTTIYYMTHNVDMDLVLPAVNVVTVAGTALLGVIWTATRRYWYVLIMLVSIGLLRGLFNDELLTDFQSVWLLISGGFVVFILLVALIARVLKEDSAKRAAAAAYAAAHPAPSKAVAAEPVIVPPPAPSPAGAGQAFAATATEVRSAGEAGADAAAAEAATTKASAKEVAEAAADAAAAKD